MIRETSALRAWQNWRRRLTLKGRLIAFTVVLMLIIIWGLVLVSATVVQDHMQQVLSDQQFASVQRIANDLDSRLRERIDGLQGAAAGLPADLSYESLQPLLAARPLLHIVFSGGIAVIGLDGRTIADYPVVPGRRGTYFGDRDYFREVAATRKPYIDKPIIGRALKRPVLTIAVPVLDGQGRLRAVMTGVTDLTAPNFLGFVGDRNLVGKGELFVFSLHDNLILAATDGKRAMAPAPARGLNVMFDRMLDGFEGSGIGVSSEGIRKLYSGKQVPVSHWLVIAGLPADVAFSPVTVLQRYLYVTGGLLTLLAVLLVRRVVAGTLAPLEAAADAMRRMTGGTAPLAPLPVGRDDEVGRLIGDFNRLIEDRRQYEDAVGESEARFRSLFGNMLEGFAYCRMVFDGGRPMDFVYVDVNPAFGRLTGLHDVAGKKVSEVIPGMVESNPGLMATYGRVAMGGAPERLESYVQEIDHWFAISVYCPEPGYFVAVFDVITERKRAEGAMQRLNRALRLLSDCNTALVHAEREQSLLEEICRLIVDKGGHRMAWVGYAEQDAAKTVRPVAHAGSGEGYLQAAQVSWGDDEHGQGPTGTALRTATVQVNHDILSNQAMGPWREVAQAQGYRASLALPLISGGSAFGVLTIYSASANAFVDDELKLLQELASDLAFGIDALRTRSQRQLAEERLAFLAHHDPLTGLPNRLLLRDRFELAIASADRDRTGVAMLFLDLDNFKQVNDSLGHDLGDRLLVALVERLQGCIRDIDTISRQGGDEFIVLLGGVSDSAVIGRVAQQMLDAVGEPFDIAGNVLTTSFSIGISLYPSDGKDFDSLLKNADTALYHAKDAGRDTFHFFASSMNVDALARMQLQGRLRGALKNQEFLLHYQPQIDIASGRIVGVEALLRWQPDDGPLVPPGHFIPVAEQSGLIIPLGEWVLVEACRQGRTWLDSGLPEMVVAVNLSALQFRRGNVLETVADALVRSGLPARCLELELTESILLQDTDAAVKTLRGLKDMGVKLSIDDFGTGYSSLSYLKRLAVDKLKIDQSFVRDIATDADDAAIVRAIIQLGHTLQLTIIAEGVETDSQAAFLTNNGCDQAQGYFYGRPVPAADLERLLRG